MAKSQCGMADYPFAALERLASHIGAGTGMMGDALHAQRNVRMQAHALC